MGQNIARNVSSDIRKMELRFGKVTKVRSEKREPVFDITFQDGSMSTFGLDEVKQAIALYAAKNCDSPE